MSTQKPDEIPPHAKFFEQVKNTSGDEDDDEKWIEELEAKLFEKEKMKILEIAQRMKREKHLYTALTYQ